jgi:RimJ/RimL family protein N-acetyltransferase
MIPAPGRSPVPDRSAEAAEPPVIALRDVEPGDLELFYAYQLDPEACRMADFTSRDRESSRAQWGRILANDSICKRTILVDGAVAGHIVSFPDDAGRREVGYWLGREFWGWGTATRALSAFLQIEQQRPLYAHTATANLASRRVLEKNGFRLTAEDDTGFSLQLGGDP